MTEPFWSHSSERWPAKEAVATCQRVLIIDEQRACEYLAVEREDHEVR